MLTVKITDNKDSSSSNVIYDMIGFALPSKCDNFTEKLLVKNGRI